MQAIPVLCQRRATPDVPHAAISDIALGPEDKLVRAVGLIRVKLQGLSGIRVGQIEKDVIFEILRWY